MIGPPEYGTRLRREKFAAIGVGLDNLYHRGHRGTGGTEEQRSTEIFSRALGFPCVSLCSLWLRVKVFLQELQTALAGIFPGFGFEAVAYFWIDFHFVGNVFLL